MPKLSLAELDAQTIRNIVMVTASELTEPGEADTVLTAEELADQVVRAILNSTDGKSALTKPQADGMTSYDTTTPKRSLSLKRTQVNVEDDVVTTGPSSKRPRLASLAITNAVNKLL